MMGTTPDTTGRDVEHERDNLGLYSAFLGAALCFILGGIAATGIVQSPGPAERTLALLFADVTSDSDAASAIAAVSDHYGRDATAERFDDGTVEVTFSVYLVAERCFAYHPGTTDRFRCANRHEREAAQVAAQLSNDDRSVPVPFPLPSTPDDNYVDAVSKLHS